MNEKPLKIYKTAENPPPLRVPVWYWFAEFKRWYLGWADDEHEETKAAIKMDDKIMRLQIGEGITFFGPHGFLHHSDAPYWTYFVPAIPPSPEEDAA